MVIHERHCSLLLPLLFPPLPAPDPALPALAWLPLGSSPVAMPQPGMASGQTPPPLRGIGAQAVASVALQMPLGALQEPQVPALAWEWGLTAVAVGSGDQAAPMGAGLVPWMAHVVGEVLLACLEQLARMQLPHRVSRLGLPLGGSPSSGGPLHHPQHNHHHHRQPALPREMAVHLASHLWLGRPAASTWLLHAPMTAASWCGTWPSGEPHRCLSARCDHAATCPPL